MLIRRLGALVALGAVLFSSGCCCHRWCGGGCFRPCCSPCCCEASCCYPASPAPPLAPAGCATCAPRY